MRIFFNYLFKLYYWYIVFNRVFFCFSVVLGLVLCYRDNEGKGFIVNEEIGEESLEF